MVTSGMKREQTFTTACLERLSALVIVIEDPATVGIPPRCSCGHYGSRDRKVELSYVEISASRAVPRGYTCIVRVLRAYVSGNRIESLGGL